MVIDSCLDDDGEPVALNYLKGLGLDAAKVVKHVVVTHWHDDHHGGAARLLKACTSAKFWCSGALKSEEFLTVAEVARDLPLGETGISELAEVLEELALRSDGARRASVGPGFVMERTLMVEREIPPLRVLALSPSSATATLAVNEIAEMLPTLKSGTRRLVAQEPNALSVVLALRFGNRWVLLGSDLEESANALTGWTAVCEVASDLGCTKAHIFKIPHHGSETGHCDRVWTERIEVGATGILTPFRSHKLPKDEDISRLLGLLGALYATASPKGRKLLVTRPPVVEKELRAVVKERWSINPEMGHIRLRFQHASDDPPSIDLVAPAYRVSAVS